MTRWWWFWHRLWWGLRPPREEVLSAPFGEEDEGGEPMVGKKNEAVKAAKTYLIERMDEDFSLILIGEKQEHLIGLGGGVYVRVTYERVNTRVHTASS